MRNRNKNYKLNENKLVISNYYETIGNRSVVIFGADSTGEIIAEILTDDLKSVKFFIDRNIEKQKRGVLINEKIIPAFSLENSLEMLTEDAIIIIASAHHEKEIYGQLISNNVENEIILIYSDTIKMEEKSDIEMTSSNAEIKMYFYAPFLSSNFGDAINAELIPKLFNYSVKKTDKYNCDMISIGSILQLFLESNFDSVNREINSSLNKPVAVWGAGFMKPPCIQDEKFFREMNFYAVRGKITKKRICQMNGKADYSDLPVGDPALMVSKCFNVSASKKYKYGLIPHFRDFYSEYITDLLCRLGDDSLLINVTEKTEDIINGICSCETILSSSLHGLIVADSFDIPNIWIRVSDSVIGGDYKFLDYYSAFDLEDKIEAFDMRKNSLPTNLNDYIKNNYLISYEKVKSVQNGLLSCFPHSLVIEKK